MIVEERTYRIQNGKMAEYLALVREEGLPIQEPILGHLIGYFVSEIGALSHVVHMWAYEDFQDRESRRQQLTNNPRWRGFMPKLSALIQSAENRILRPTDFSPLR